tara:strand:+ start:370 stop:816 length:447 start_codon:yes stop_codon:yes gene_type:complete
MLGISEIVLIIILIIIITLVTSVIGGLILWGLARGLGKIENATFLNSWGLYWILSIAQTFIGAIFFGIFFALAFNSFTINAIIAIIIVLYIINYILSIFIALGITKAFWKCTFKQSMMTHLIPIILYFIFTVISFVLFMADGGTYYVY